MRLLAGLLVLATASAQACVPWPAPPNGTACCPGTDRPPPAGCKYPCGAEGCKCVNASVGWCGHTSSGGRCACAQTGCTGDGDCCGAGEGAVCSAGTCYCTDFQSCAPDKYRCPRPLANRFGSSAGLKLERPGQMGQGYDMAGFQGIGYRLALGQTAGRWIGSHDGGRSWQAVLPSGGVSGGVAASVLSSPDSRHDLGAITQVPDKRRPYRQFNSSSCSWFNLTTDGLVQAGTERRPVVFGGIPPPGFSCGTPRAQFGCPFRTGGRGYVEMPDGTLVMSVIVWWGGPHANPNPKLAGVSTSVVAFRSADKGFTWLYSGVVLDASAAPHSEEGPNENDLVLLADGSTIMAVIRLDAGDGPLTRPYLPYVRVLSSDGGRSWSRASSLPPKVGSARPRLMRTDDGQIVLSGGRSGPKNRDTMVWLNSGRDGGAGWRAYSVTYWHNTLEPNSTLHFTAAVNDSSFRQTMSYTSLVKTGPQTGLVTYARRLAGTPDVAFSMPFTVEAI